MCHVLTFLPKTVKRVQYMFILVKNWIFVFLDKIFFSSACGAWKARVVTFMVGTQKVLGFVSYPHKYPRNWPNSKKVTVG